MQKSYFPQMSLSDIINSLSGWGLSFSQEQLHRPTPDFVETVYCACLQQATGIDQHALRDPVQNALSASSITDDKDLLYGAALTSNLLVYHLTRFAHAAKVEDFNARDIYTPERERTIILLSAFINFIKFTEQFCGAFVNDLRDRSETIIVERSQMAEKLETVQRNIDILKAKMAEDEPRCEQLRNENSTLQAKMIATKEFQIAVVKEVENLKAEKTSLIKRKEALNGEVASVSDTIVRTRSRIVQSPERIKRTISTMSSTAIEDKKTVLLHEAKARDLQTKIGAITNIEKDLRGCVEQLQTIEKEVHFLQVAQKELADLKDHLDGKNIERNELRLRQERVEKQLANAKEKLERAQRHADDKRIASQRTLDRLKREYDEMVVDRRDNDKQVEELRTEADEVERKMNEHLKSCEAELNELLAEYWKLRHETDVYMETLANKLNMKVTSD